MPRAGLEAGSALSAAGPAGDAVFLGRPGRPLGRVWRVVEPGPQFEELEGGFDLAGRAAIQAAVGTLVHAPGTLRALLRPGAGPLRLDPSEVVEQVRLGDA